MPDCGLKSSYCVVIIADLELQSAEVTLPLQSKVVVTLEKQKQNKFRKLLSECVSC